MYFAIIYLFISFYMLLSHFLFYDEMEKDIKNLYKNRNKDDLDFNIIRKMVGEKYWLIRKCYTRLFVFIGFIIGIGWVISLIE
jgi:hypothetical protein